MNEYFDNSLKMFGKNILSTINARFDRLEKMLCNAITLPLATKNDEKYKNMFKIKTIENMNEFEIKLCDKIYYNETVSFLQKINGSGREWRPSCYTLCDTMFSK